MANIKHSWDMITHDPRVSPTQRQATYDTADVASDGELDASCDCLIHSGRGGNQKAKAEARAEAAARASGEGRSVFRQKTHGGTH